MGSQVAKLFAARDDFLASGTVDSGLRSLVAQSWLRSVESGLDPERDLAPITIDGEELERIRRAHPLAAGLPVIRRLLVDSAAEAGLIVAVSDAAGQLLWVEGARSLRSRAESIHFVPGADWSEAGAGTNAPGTALTLGRPVSLLGPEHLARSVTPWSCSAAPIKDPDTGAILGVLDLTGGDEAAAPTSLALVRATAAAVEAELRIERLRAHEQRVVTGWTPAADSVDVLGVRRAVLHHGSSTTRLSHRHSEIVLLLALADQGLTSAEIAVSISAEELSNVTIRAELSRLRSVLGSVTFESRPYRFAQPLRTDVAVVREALESGQLRRATAAYRGPILPESTAPAVVELREELHWLVRSHLLGGDNIDALLAFADTTHGHDDLEVWERIAKILPLESPRFSQVMDHVAKLDDAQG